MVAKTVAALLAEITTSFPDNTQGLITPAIQRTMLNDIVLSYLNLADTGITTVFVPAGGDIQAAINSLPTSAPNPGGVVHLAAGKWTNHATITLPSGVRMEGEGNVFSTNSLNVPSFPATWIDFTGSSTGIHAVDVGGIAIANIGIANASGNGVLFEGVRNFVLDQVSVFGASSIGFNITRSGIDASYFGTLNNCYANALSNANSIGLSVTGLCSEILALGCEFTNNGLCGINVDGGDNIKLVACDCEGTVIGIRWGTSASSDGTIMMCRFEGTQDGVALGAFTAQLSMINNNYSNTIGILGNYNPSVATLLLSEPFLNSAAFIGDGAHPIFYPNMVQLGTGRWTGNLPSALFSNGIIIVPTVFASLPASPPDGTRGYITNCSTNTWGATADGAGAHHVPVWYSSESAAWRVG